MTLSWNLDIPPIVTTRFVRVVHASSGWIDGAGPAMTQDDALTPPAWS